MSQAAVSIFADLQLRSDKIAAQGKEARDQLLKALGGGPSGMTAIPLNVELPKDLQQRLQAKLNAMTLTVNVSPNFGGGGGVNGPLPQVPGGMAPIPGMAGASSPNWSYINRQQQQQQAIVQQAMNAAAAPAATPYNKFAPQNYFRSQVGNGGGGGGGSNLYNPFSPRGLTRMVGSGMAVYGALSAMHIATGLLDAQDTMDHPERILRGMDSLGSRHNASSDPFMQRQAQTMADNQGQQQIRSAVDSLPIVGSLAKFIRAVDGTTHELTEAAKSIERTTEIYRYAQGKVDSAQATAAGLTRDPAEVMRERHNREREADDNDLRMATDDLYSAKTPAEVQQKGAALRKIQRARGLNVGNRADEQVWRVKEEAAKDILSGSSVTSSNFALRATQAAMAGTPIGELALQHESQIAAAQASFEARRKTAGPQERARIDAEEKAAIPVLKARLGWETQQAVMQRNLSLGNMDARNTSIGAQAAEGLTRAGGATGLADRQSVQRETMEHAQALRREADAQTDAAKAAKLMTQAMAEEAAGATKLKAIRLQEVRESTLDNAKAGQGLEVSRMDAGGHHFGAHRQSIMDRYQQEADAIRLKQMDPKAEREQIEAAKKRRDSSLMGLQAGRTASNTSMAIEGLDAAARASGQEGVGGVLSFGEELRQRYRDANGDKAQTKLVDAYKTAEIAARRRQLRPHDAGMRYGGMEYHDVLQGQINTQYGHSAAIKALAGVAGINATNAGSPAMAEQKAANDLQKAAAGLQKAADTLLKRKAV